MMNMYHFNENCHYDEKKFITDMNENNINNYTDENTNHHYSN